ncbi:MAG: RNA polymerase sigma factor [Leptospiraceae bacterium]|jgi:RNA polymerase sigma-70 factor (ECF subfamily)|nr:RNA polymerase sigma factor [Leptospiraceae bacterium]
MDLNNNTEKDFIKALYDEYANDILIFLYRMTKDYQLSCDLLQDTFLNFIKKASENKIKDKNKAKTYLFQTAKNLFINNYRKLKKFVVISYDDAIDTREETTNPEENYISEEDESYNEKVLNELLEYLDNYEKTLIVLRYQSNLKIEEIAEIIDKSPSSATRALQKIQKKLLKIAKEKKII